MNILDGLVTSVRCYYNLKPSWRRPSALSGRLGWPGGLVKVSHTEICAACEGVTRVMTSASDRQGQRWAALPSQQRGKSVRGRYEPR